MNIARLKSSCTVHPARSAWVVVFALHFVAATSSRALIPEPDNILYGTITLDNVPITAAMTNVVVEARRTTNGPAVASYRMGANSQIGSYYSLAIPVESIAPINDPNASPVGDALVIVLRDISGVRAQTNFVIVERGQVLRTDFGLAVADSDSDGLPDAWELYRFGSLVQSPTNFTANGQTVLQHFIAGTDPNDLQSGFRLHIDLTNNLKRVWFVAGAAEGPGYGGISRRYSLEFRANIAAGFWTDVPNYIDIPGSNQTVNYVTAALGAPGFYRGRISLVGYTPPGVTSTVPPILTIVRAGLGKATLSWTPDMAGWFLQESLGYAATNWIDSLSGTNNPATIPIIEPVKFYRLRQF